MRKDSFPPAALERWAHFQRHRPGFTRQALRLVGNRADAADLVQEVGLRVLRHPTGPRPDACFKSWCFGLLRNAAADQRRSLNRRLRLELENIDGSDPDSPQLQPLDPEVSLDMRRLVERVGSLDNTARDLVIRRYFLGETATEIAHDFKSSPPAIRMKLKRLRARLRELLEAATVVALVRHADEISRLVGAALGVA